MLLPQRYEFSSKSQQRHTRNKRLSSCCCYRKGTNFQANHNYSITGLKNVVVVVATAKVRIFKQITTLASQIYLRRQLLLLPQRYEFSSKSQRYGSARRLWAGCCCYRKGTNFQANHNSIVSTRNLYSVVVATAKVRIFKQITTEYAIRYSPSSLLLLPQRYEFSSKSQRTCNRPLQKDVVVATAKVRIFKQITTD